MMTFDYRNHRGEISTRRLRSADLIYDAVIHPEHGYMQPGWYIRGFDEDKQAVRSFALHNICVPEMSLFGDVPFVLAFPMTFGLPIA